MHLFQLLRKTMEFISFSTENINADKNKSEIEISSLPVSGNEFYLKVKVSKGGICDFSYQTGKRFTDIF